MSFFHRIIVAMIIIIIITRLLQYLVGDKVFPRPITINYSLYQIFRHLIIVRK